MCKAGSTLVTNRLSHVWIVVVANVCVLVKVLADVCVGARVAVQERFSFTSKGFALAIAEYIRDEPIAQWVPHFRLNKGF